MISLKRFRELAVSMEGVTESPHFEKASFRIKGKIIAALDAQKKVATLKLSETDQSVFISFGKGAIYAVPNKWGKQGWTCIELDKVMEEIVADALATAYAEVLKKRPGKTRRP